MKFWGGKANSAPSFIESDGSVITKPTDITNYFNYFFIGKISKLRDDMQATNADTTHPRILDQIMKDKNCIFEFRKVSVEEVTKVLLFINNDKPQGSDNLNGKLQRIIGIATPICQIFNLSLLESVCPQAWRETKVIPLPKNSKAPFTGSNRRQICLLPTLRKLLEKNVFDQIQCYFTVNKLTTDFQCAYREGHSTSTALTQVTDDWLR